MIVGAPAAGTSRVSDAAAVGDRGDTAAALPSALVGWVATRGGRQALAAARLQIEAGRTGNRARVSTDFDAQARRDVGRLLGLTWQTSGRPLSLGQFRAAVAAAGADLTDLLVHVGGPLRHRPTERAQVAGAQAQRRDLTKVALADAGLPDVVIELLIARRWLGAAAAPELPERAGRLAAVLRALPGGPRGASAAEGTLLATLASDLFADPHTLDRDTMLGRAAVRVLAARAAAKSGAGPAVTAEAADACASAAGWRAAWSAAGVTCDRLSSTVLVLNLPLPGSGPAAVLLRAAAAVAEPVWLTARSLVAPWPLEAILADLPVRVCENPSVVESAADRLGADCAALVCTYGRPSTAAWLLLTALSRCGAQILVSADRDSAGDSIARELLARLPGSRPWLPDAPGRYEEDRLPALLGDLSGRADHIQESRNS